jgi:putative Ig domain-containing protein/ASPM-SPD-2-Hydin domain-containing protein
LPLLAQLTAIVGPTKGSIMFRTRFAAVVAVSVVALTAGAGQALASHGGGGGAGGGGTTTPPSPPPATAPAVSLSPSTVTFGPQAVGTTSASQTVTLTNTGTASLFINGVSSGGLDQLDFNRTNDQCIGMPVAAGTSCTITIVFNPTATGTRTMTLSVIDTAASSPQVMTLTGTGTSVNGPTPLSVDTTGLTCTTGVCQLGIPGDQLVKNFYFANLSTLGQTVPPFTWTLVGGALPPGVTLFSNGQIYGTPTATGTTTFTVKVTDANGQTATQAFSLTISPQPPPLTAAEQGCQHAPGQTTAALTGPAIAGKTPTGQGIGDQSQLTACGGFTVIRASVQNVSLPNGTVLWVTLGGEPIGRITLTNGAGTMAPWTLAISTLRKQGMGVFSQPPTGSTPQSPLLSGPFV